MNPIKKSAGNLQYAHRGFVTSGANEGTRLELTAPLDHEKDYTKVVQGSIISLTADGKFAPGCEKGDAASTMRWDIPCVCIKNYFDQDVTTGRVAPAGFPLNETYSFVGGQATGVPLTAGYEIETSEYDAEALKNAELGTALVAGTEANLGKVTVATTAPGAAVPYLGYLSGGISVRGSRTNQYAPATIRFLSDFIPNFTEA